MSIKKITYKPLLALFPLFFLFYVLNYLTPMSFGDDYVYAFVWEGHSMYKPMSEQVQRVMSLQDLLVSQWSHYFTGNGRAVSHTIAQFFIWIGKSKFNFVNALISVFLLFEIYWAAHKGKASFDFNLGILYSITFLLWAFTPGFSPVFFWLSGACNYLWSAVFLLGFLLPYIRKYFFFETRLFGKPYFKYFMFFFGVIAGWSNENSICWIILVIAGFLYINRNNQDLECWMFTGLLGLVIGYALLLFSPGNYARFHLEIHATEGWARATLLKENLTMLFMVFFFQFLLWYFNLRSIFILKSVVTFNEKIKKEWLLVITLCSLSFGMSGIMLLSPNFPPRSSFPGTVQLIVASCMLLRIQEEYKIEIIKTSAKRFLVIIGTCYFLISGAATFYGFYDYHVQMQNMLSVVNNAKKDRILTVPAFIPVCKKILYISGFHLLFYEMSADVNDWRNVAFARYYGIKGIRMLKRD